MAGSQASSSNYYAHFEIDIVEALATQLTDALEQLSLGDLTPKIIQNVPRDQGIYQLFHDGVLVYVGKASNLAKRLLEHHLKISGRHNIAVGSMKFKCLTVHPNWTALAPETTLISYYKKQSDGQCDWNGNGFGPHDPGRNRELTNKAPEGFDSLYPIRADWVCESIESGRWELLDLLVALKDRLPYLLRYEVGDRAGKKGHYKAGHPDHWNKEVDVPRSGMTAEELLKLITAELPGWQATAFPSHLILYKEKRQYAHGQIIHQTPAMQTQQNVRLPQQV